MIPKLFDLSGRVALVTGGARDWARRWRRASPRPAPTSSSPAVTRTSSRRRPRRSGRATTTRVEYVVADMTRRDEANRLAAAAIETMSRVDILVNNAGSNLPQPIDQIRDEDWDRLVELNLSSCMALTRALVPPMKERQVGPDHPHLVDHGLHLGRRPQRLLGDQERAAGPGPGQRQRPRPLRHHRQLHRPRPVPDRPARQPALAGAARRLRPHAPRWAAGASPRS